jgi:nicotinate-nucleotide pyrophosphorylase (carboxylating)
MNSISVERSLIPTWKKLIQLGLEEDSFAFDWTARAAKNSQIKSLSVPLTKASLIAKSNGVWAGAAGLLALEIVSREMGMPISVESKVSDGDLITPKQIICEWTGEAASLLMFERSMINLTAYASGIATQTRQLVAMVDAKKMKNPVRITGTRKTLPGYKELAVQSTLIGGAHPHRLNLSGGLLIKENHVSAAGGIATAIANARNTAPHLLKIEIEVRNLDELKQAIAGSAEVIMLDNFTPAQISEAIKIKPTGVCFEVSGGINASNLDSYLIEGLDVISVGSITHSVTSVDLSLLLESPRR